MVNLLEEGVAELADAERPSVDLVGAGPHLEAIEDHVIVVHPFRVILDASPRAFPSSSEHGVVRPVAGIGMDLLVTAIASDAETELTLLGRVLQVLHAHPVLWTEGVDPDDRADDATVPSLTVTYVGEPQTAVILAAIEIPPRPAVVVELRGLTLG